MTEQKIARPMNTGRDIEVDGDVLPIADLHPDMEIDDGSITIGQADFVAARSLTTALSSRSVPRRASRRGGRSYEEVSGRDMGREIDERQAAQEVALGRPLTDDEMTEIARSVQLESTK